MIESTKQIEWIHVIIVFILILLFFLYILKDDVKMAMRKWQRRH